MEEIMVTIVCLAYNHEKYIRKCLEGFVMQKTNFGFEVLVHDDASTDGTTEIIREFEKEYPNIIKPIYQIENQYSKPGVSITREFIIPRLNKKYVAICEGDDYWTDPYKLQKQFDVLETHPEIDMCACKAKEVVANTEEFIRYVAPKDKDCVIPLDDVIMGGGNYLATCSLFLRTTLRTNEYSFIKKIRIDYSDQISGAIRGGIYYINDDMCSYRTLSDGSWTQKVSKDSNKKINTYKKIIEMLKEVNNVTNSKHENAIFDRIDYYEFQIALVSKDYKNLKKHKKRFKEYIMSISFKGRIYTYYMILRSLLSR